MAWNKRIAKRRTLVFYLEVFERNEGRLLGRIGDLTEHGMMLLQNEKLEPESVYQVSISIPQEILLPVTSIETSVSIQWVKPDINPALWSMGCKFLDLDETTQRHIRHLIEELGFEDYHLSRRMAFD